MRQYLVWLENMSDSKLRKKQKNTNQKNKNEYERRYVYRYLESKDHAMQLCDGYVWLSTLKTVRGHPTKDDKNDGTIQFYLPPNGEGVSIPATQRVISLMPGLEEYQAVPREKATVVIANFDFVVSYSLLPALESLSKNNKGAPIGQMCLLNCGIIVKHPDAYLLCTSMKKRDAQLRRVFGENVVQISKPELFKEIVTNELQKHCRVKSPTARRVDYELRHINPNAPEEMLVGFASAKINEWESEYRMLWPLASDQPIKPLLLYIPEIKGLCTLL